MAPKVTEPKAKVAEKPGKIEKKVKNPKDPNASKKVKAAKKPNAPKKVKAPKDLNAPKKVKAPKPPPKTPEPMKRAIKEKKSSIQRKKITTLQRKIRLMKQKYAMYPEKPAKKKGAFPKVTLRRRLTPGTVVILVAGRQHYKGIRMIFVKLLESGHLLLAGPHSLNRRPLMPVLQNFVIATSTKIPLTKEATLAAKKINFSMFKTVKKQKPKDSGIFTDSAAVESTGPRIDPDLVKALDSALMNSVEKYSKDSLEKEILKSYLRRKFTVKEGQYPHAMKF